MADFGRGKGGKGGKGARAPASANPENAALIAFLDDKRAECQSKQQENLMYVYARALKSVREHDLKIHSAVRYQTVLNWTRLPLRTLSRQGVHCNRPTAAS
jgi:hypothetical protein